MTGWGLFQIIVVLGLLVGAGYFVDKTYNHGIRVLVKEFLGEVRRFVKLDPSLEALNMLFGVFSFVALILLVGAVAVSSLFSKAMPGDHSLHIPGDMFIVVGFFFMMVFFALSIAFCLAMRKK
jgi:hypothetical protein